MPAVVAFAVVVRRRRVRSAVMARLLVATAEALVGDGKMVALEGLGMLEMLSPRVGRVIRSRSRRLRTAANFTPKETRSVFGDAERGTEKLLTLLPRRALARRNGSQLYIFVLLCIPAQTRHERCARPSPGVPARRR